MYNVHLYTIIICTDGMAIYRCLCSLLAIACVICYWLDVHQQWYAYLCGYRKATDNFMLAFVSYNITKCFL